MPLVLADAEEQFGYLAPVAFEYLQEALIMVKQHASDTAESITPSCAACEPAKCVQRERTRRSADVGQLIDLAFHHNTDIDFMTKCAAILEDAAVNHNRAFSICLAERTLGGVTVILERIQLRPTRMVYIRPCRCPRTPGAWVSH